jgi:hypothetical protein
LRNKKTEAAYEAFLRGRSENSERLAGLVEQLDKLAPVNVAMGLGRMPSIAARILRACDEQGLLGGQLIVVGTSAMFAYEVQAGVQIDSGPIATGDIDLLYDARRRLSLAVTGMATEGLIGLLKNHLGRRPPVGVETGEVYPAGGRERPMAFWWQEPRKKTWPMGCSARESGDAVRRSRLGN